MWDPEASNGNLILWTTAERRLLLNHYTNFVLSSENSITITTMMLVPDVPFIQASFSYQCWCQNNNKTWADPPSVQQWLVLSKCAYNLLSIWQPAEKWNPVLQIQIWNGKWKMECIHLPLFSNANRKDNKMNIFWELHRGIQAKRLIPDILSSTQIHLQGTLSMTLFCCTDYNGLQLEIPCNNALLPQEGPYVSTNNFSVTRPRVYMTDKQS